MRKNQITVRLIDRLLETLAQVHAAGVFWGDCRPDNLGIAEGEPLLIDWNLAIESGDLTHPHNGTRCFVSQNLLRSTEQQTRRTCNDDKESLLGLSNPEFCKEINEIKDATACADHWERTFTHFSKPIDEAFEIMKCITPAYYSR